MPADALGDVAGSIARLNRLNDGRQAMREAGDWFVRNRERLETLSTAERQAWLALLDEHVRAGTRDAGVPVGVAEIEALTDAFFIDLMPEQATVVDKGGTMRLGIYPCKVMPDTLTYAAYQDEIIYERHRHRFEFNNAYREKLTSQGLVLGGTLPNDRLVEVVEIKDHPWYVGTQFHPELKSRPTNPHPLFRDFVKAALKNKK